MPQKGCICEICSCGRHKCPLHPTRPKNDFQECKITEYNNKYRAYDIGAKPETFKPKPQMVQDSGPLDDATTFKTDYIKHPVQPKFAGKQDVYVKPDGNMDMITSYYKDYPHKAADKAVSSKPHYAYQGDEVPFEGHPTYKDDYRAWKASKPEAIKKDKMYVPPSATMENRTTNRTDFVPLDLPMTRSFKPENVASVNKDPLDDLTNHRIDYVKHPMAEKVWRPKEEYRPTKAPLESLTTAQRDYIGHALPRQENFKPKNTGVHSDQPLDDATEFKDSYKQWQMPKKDTRVRDAYVKPAGVMDNTTSHRKDFVQHQLQPARSLKPQNVSSGNDAQFDDTTTFKTDYKPWQPTAERRGDPSRRNYELPTVPFEGMPTYKSHYVEHGLAPQRSFKPDNFVDASKAPFEGNTSYKTEYTLKQTEPCPASNLPGHGYRLLETNSLGHLVYTK